MTHAPPPRRHGPLACSWVVAATLLVLLTHWEAPQPIAPTRLDPSYMQATGMALAQGLGFGREVLFTFGPLGWFNTSPALPHEPAWFWLKIAWELGVRGGLVLVLVALTLRLERPWERALCVLALLLPGMRSDSWWFLAAAGLTVWDATRARASPAREFALALGWTLIALVKFTFLIACGLAGLAAVVIAWRGRSPREALRLAAIALAVFAAVWLALGQSLAALPEYVRWSLQLTRGYSEGMSLAPLHASALAWAAFAAALCLATVALTLVPGERGARRWMLCALFGLLTFLAFKAGYVRAFGAILFFGFTAAAPYVAALSCRGSEPGRAGRLAPWLRVAGLLAGLGGSLATGFGFDTPVDVARGIGRNLAEHAPGLVDPWSLRAELEQASARRVELFAMPRTRAHVGRLPVEVFAGEHAILALNDLHWKPRLVPFAFSVLTADTAQRNAEDLDQRGADFVLLRGGAADGRVPTSEDGAALRVLLARYQPVLAERGFLLFQRSAAARPVRVSEFLHKPAVFGETLELDGVGGHELVLRLDLRPSALGALRTTLYQAETLWIEATTRSGRTLRLRWVPEMMRTGALVRPLLEDHDAWMRWVTGDETDAIVRLHFLPPERPWAWEPLFELVLESHAGLAPDPRPTLRWSMFDTAPLSVDAPTGTRHAFYLQRDEVLRVGAPSRLVFELPQGASRLSAGFGFLRETLAPGSTDGAVFRVVAREDGAEARTLYERRVTPIEVRSDRDLIPLALDVETAAGGELWLETDPGPAGDARGDEVFWTAVRLEPR